MSYPLREAARILKVPPARLRSWERSGLVMRSVRVAERHEFGFRDLVGARTLVSLLEHGVPLRRIRRSVEAFRERMPELEQPLGAMRVWVEGSRRVVLRHQGELYEPDGQMVLDLRPPAGRGEDEAVAPLARQEPDGRSAAQEARECFERGCELDSSPATYGQAAELYRRAVEADPEFADAHCNLGTVYYNQGRRSAARECFERTLELVPGHAEASFNLANLLEGEGETRAALRHLKASMEADPFYADAQLNAALIYEKLGVRSRARDHWRRYLQLDPDGTWASVARQRLQEPG